jgi:hypothetical protein
MKSKRSYLRRTIDVLKGRAGTRRATAYLCLGVALSACSSAPIIYSSKDLPNGVANGSVPPLRETLPTDGTPIRLIMVHGVGDHCPGYALDPDQGWLKTKTITHLGITPIPGTFEKPRYVNVSVFMGGAADKRARVAFSRQSYVLRLRDQDPEVKVEAIEITWSPLTQWLKSNQLGYDSPSTTPLPGANEVGCTEAPDADIPVTKEPPPRLLVDRIIKESVFDRSLADAILYSGTYGPVMERGLAEALCHAITSTPDDKKCEWPTDEERRVHPHRYYFLTHSLGSRMTYDVMLDLCGYRTDAKANPFTSNESDKARQFVAGMLADTNAVYMMANQLSLLGLANVPPDARSGTGLHPYLEFKASSLISAEPGVTSAPPQTRSTNGSSFGDVLRPLAQIRASVRGSENVGAPTLQILSFNDTNDLLTWHVPPWYVNDDPDAPDSRPEISITNVFVRNSPPLLVLESPAPAHSNYFVNQDVWDVIRCGAQHGVVLQCS